MRISGTVAIVSAGLIMVGAADANSATIINKPTDFSNLSSSEYPALSTFSEASLGQGSWQADPNTGQHLIYLQGGSPGPFDGGATSYSTPGKNPRLLWSIDEDVTIADIVSISWDTKTTSSVDWFVDIFTYADGTDDDAWYGKNFDLTVDNMQNTSGNGGFTTHTFDKDGGEAFDNKELSISGPVPKLTLADLQQDYGTEKILFVALATATNYTSFDGYVDNFQFSFLDDTGAVVERQVDLEPVPLPAAAWLLISAFGGLFGMRWLKGRQEA